MADDQDRLERAIAHLSRERVWPMSVPDGYRKEGFDMAVAELRRLAECMCGGQWNPSTIQGHRGRQT